MRFITHALAANRPASSRWLFRLARSGLARAALSPSWATPRRLALTLGVGASSGGLLLSRCDGGATTSIFTPVQQEDVAMMLAERINVGPFIMMPAALKEAIASRIVAAVAEAVGSSELDEASRAEIQRAVETVTAGVSPETVDRVVAVVNKHVNVPLVDEATEHEILRQAVSLMLGDTGPLELLGSSVRSGGGIVRRLLQPEQRAKLAATLAARIDLPFLDEAQEKKLLERVIEGMGGALERLLPAETVRALDGLDKEELDQVKQLTVARLQATTAAALPFVPAEQQQRAIGALVDAAFDALADSSLGAAVLAPAEQLERLKRAEATLRASADSLARQGARRQAEIARRLAAVERQKKQLKKEIRASRKRWWLW